MTPHCSTLAWKIPWMEEPGGLQSLGLQRVGHDWRDLAAAGGGGCWEAEQIWCDAMQLGARKIWIYGPQEEGALINTLDSQLSLTGDCILTGSAYSVASDSSQPHRLKPTRLLCPWNFPGKKTGVGCCLLLQGIFPMSLVSPALAGGFFSTAPPNKSALKRLKSTLNSDKF